MGDQFGATGFAPAATHAGLKRIQQQRVGKVFHHKALQLQGPKGLQVGAEVDAHHLGIQAGDMRQQGVELLAVGVTAVEQTRHGTVDHGHHLRHRPVLQLCAAGLAHARGQGGHVCSAELRHLHLHREGVLRRAKVQGVPIHLMV